MAMFGKEEDKEATYQLSGDKVGGNGGILGGNGILSGLGNAQGTVVGGKAGTTGGSGIGSGATVGTTGPLTGSGIKEVIDPDNNRLQKWGDVMSSVGDVLGQFKNTNRAQASSFRGGSSARPVQDNSMQAQILNGMKQEAMGNVLQDTDYTKMGGNPALEQLLAKLG